MYPFVVKGFCVASCILATIWSTPDMAGGSIGPMPACLLYRSPEMSPHCCAMLIRFMACKETDLSAKMAQKYESQTAGGLHEIGKWLSAALTLCILIQSSADRCRTTICQVVHTGNKREIMSVDMPCLSCLGLIHTLKLLCNQYTIEAALPL